MRSASAIAPAVRLLPALGLALFVLTFPLPRGTGAGRAGPLPGDTAPLDVLLEANSAVSPDGRGNTGRYTSLQLDAAGNPVIAYYDDTNAGLKLLHCGDSNCTRGNSTVSVDTGSAGTDTSLQLDVAGNPVVSYYESGGGLKLVYCGNSTCSAGNTTVRFSNEAGETGDGTALRLTANGNPVIAYYNAGRGDLRIISCQSSACSPDYSYVAPDSPGTATDVGRYPTLALDASGYPVAAYYDVTHADLRLLRCASPSCSSFFSPHPIDSEGDVGRYPSLALDSAARPVVAYYDATNGDLKLVHCGSTLCDAGNTVSIVDAAGNTGQYPSLALDAAGRPVISYYDATNGDLKVARCGDASCSTGNSTAAVDTAGDVGQYTSLVLDADGNPVVSYYDATNGDLKVLHCSTPACTNPIPAQLAFAATPVRLAQGFPFGKDFVVEVRDELNAQTADSTTEITLRIRAGTGTPGAVLSCSGSPSLTLTASLGSANFGHCSIDRMGSGYVLEATALNAAMPVAATAPFSVVWPADANGDCRVSAIDFSLLITDMIVGGLDADFNGDETTDAADLSILLARFGARCSA